MIVCPECGGEMKFDRRQNMYVCLECGLAMTRHELYQSREQLMKEIYGEERNKNDYKKEYLKWWLSKKE